jgi:serine/threonine-protein kinase
MKVPPPSPGNVAPEAPSDLETVLEQFEDAWRSGRPPRLEDFLSRSVEPRDRRKLLEELLKIDLDYRWHPGLGRTGPAEPTPVPNLPRLEDYAKGYPALVRLDQLPPELIAEEYRVRRRRGDRPRHDEFLARFPHVAPVLGTLLRQIDEELAAESAKDNSPAADVRPPSGLEPEPVQPVTTVPALVEAVRRCRLLSPPQLDELTRGLSGRFADARALARELLQRGWLTAYQVNQLLLGRGADLQIGQYLVLERLGEGGTGQVFKARHQNMNRVVALKVIRRELLADAEVVQRFYREIQVISKLAHPSVVHAYDAGPIGRAHVLVMEYVEGTDLDRLVKQSGPLPVAQASDYIRQAAVGLQHIHGRNLVHRDIKPSNLLVSGVAANEKPAQQVKILDLGLARLQRGGKDGDATSVFTPTGAVMIGTPNYLAPEQAIDFHAADIRSDIYGLGCTFYYLLTGQPPFPGGSLAEKLLKHQQKEPPPVEQLRPDVPPALAVVLRRMLAKRPEDRYQTPGELAGALEPFARGPEAAPMKAAAVGANRFRRWRTPALAGLAVLIAAIAGVVLLSPSKRGPTAPTASIPGGSSPLDSLDPNQIPSELRWKEQQPAELVAVLGKKGEGSQDSSLSISQDGTFVAWSDSTGTIHLWDAVRGTQRHSVKLEKPRPPVAVSADGKTLAWNDGTTKPQDEWIVLWDIPSGRERHRLKAKGLGGSFLTFAADGKKLAAGGKGATVYLWDDLSAGSNFTKLTDVGGNLRCLRISPDGKLLALAVRDENGGRVAIVDLTTGKPAQVRSRPGQIVEALAFALPNGETLATGSYQSPAIVLWETAREGDRGQIAEPNGKNILSLAFAPDGKLAAAAKDGHVTVWENLAGKKPLQRWTMPVGVTAVAFAPDGRHLFTANADNTVSILRLGRR